MHLLTSLTEIKCNKSFMNCTKLRQCSSFFFRVIVVVVVFPINNKSWSEDSRAYHQHHFMVFERFLERIYLNCNETINEEDEYIEEN
jgi:hypothetical protein